MNKSYLLLALILAYTGLSFATEVTAITNFKLNKYLGTWYEIARTPNWFEKKCIAPIQAIYTIDSKNTKQINVSNQCNTIKQKIDITDGEAVMTESANIAKLKVTFLPKLLRWLPVGHGDYWVLYVDYDNMAVVGSPDHEYLWILARQQNLTSADLAKAKQIAQQQGFETDKLIIN